MAQVLCDRSYSVLTWPGLRLQGALTIDSVQNPTIMFHKLSLAGRRRGRKEKLLRLNSEAKQTLQSKEGLKVDWTEKDNMDKKCVRMTTASILRLFTIKKQSMRDCKQKIPHTGNTWPSRMCVIQEYWYYTMCLSQYHGCCQYHESKSIPWVCANTISPNLYHESMSIPWVHVSTMSPCLYHESMSVPEVRFYTRSPFLYHESMFIPLEIQFSETQKYK